MNMIKRIRISILPVLMIASILIMSAASMIFADGEEAGGAEASAFDANVISSEYLDGRTIIVSFDKDIELTEDARARIQKYQYWEQALASGDSIYASGSEFRLVLAASNTNLSKIIFKEGSLRLADGTVNEEAITAEISSPKKRITNVTYSALELPSGGGTVKASLEGEFLNELGGWISANVYEDGELAESIKPSYDESSCSFTFRLPANTGDKDKHYTLKFTKTQWDATPVEAENGGDLIITVAGLETAAEPVVREAVLSRSSLKAPGGEIRVSLRGEALKQLKAEDLTVTADGSDASIPVTYNASTDSAAEAVFVIPENTSHEDVIYTFSILRGADGEAFRSQTIRLLAVNDSPLVESIQYPSSLTRFNFNGMPDTGYTSLVIDLKGDNLDRLTEKDFEFRLDGDIISLISDAADPGDNQLRIEYIDPHTASARIIFPANTIEKQRTCTITILAAPEGTAGRTREIPMDRKPEDKADKFRIPANKWSASLVGESTVRIDIEGISFRNDGVWEDSSADISLAADPEDYKHNSDYIKAIRNLIYFSDTKDDDTDLSAITPGGEPDGMRLLSDEDEVTIDSNSIYITFADYGRKIPGWAIFRTGALKAEVIGAGGADPEIRILGRDEYDRWHSRYIEQTPHIDSIEFNRITFDHRGGEVRAKIRGSLLNTSTPDLWAKVFIDRSNTYSGYDQDDSADAIVPEVKVSDNGESGEIIFNVPENRTDKTITYRMTPVINGVNTVPLYIKGYDVISVLPEGASEDDVTLSWVEMQGAYDMDDDPAVFKTSTSSEQFTTKVDAVLRGTNLHSKKTLIRAVDENGVVWPMLPVFECGATIRWQNSSYYLPEKASKNEQHIELLLPRRLGVTRTFTLQFAPDGENWLEDPTATVVIVNEGLFDQDAIQSGQFDREDFTELKDLEIRYVDESGRELAPSDHYKGYGITELYHLGIAPKNIDGYEVKSTVPEKDILDNVLYGPVQHESGEFIFPRGQYFMKHLKDDDGSISPIVYTYAKKSAGGKTEPGSGDTVKPGTGGSDKPESGSKNTEESGKKAASRVSIAKAKITVKPAAYTGKALTPAVTVRLGGKTLKKGTDYTVKYANNKKAGRKASVTVTGKGRYKGTARKTFTIAKAGQPMKVKAKKLKNFKAKTISKKAQTVKKAKAFKFAKKAQGKITYKLGNVNKTKFRKYFRINEKNGNITLKKGLKKGTYKLTVKITAKGNVNYKRGTKTVKLIVRVR